MPIITSGREGIFRTLCTELENAIRRSIRLQRAEEALLEREQRYHDLQNANDLIQSVAPDGRFIYVNKKWMDTLGYREGDVSRLTIYDIIHPDSLSHCMETFGRVLSGENVGIIDAAFKTRGGERVFVEGIATCRIAGGVPHYTRGLFKDVTERKAAERKLAEAEEFNRRIIESSHECIKVLDLDGNLLSMSSYGQQELGIADITPYLGTRLFALLAGGRPGESPEGSRRSTAERQGTVRRSLCRGDGRAEVPGTW